MPLTPKGQEIKAALQKEYGAKKGEEVLYAGQNKGTLKGIDAKLQADADLLASGKHISGRDRKAMIRK